MTSIYTLADLRTHIAQGAAEMHRESFDALLVQNDQTVVSRRHFAPGHITASGFVINRPRTHVLLIRHPSLGRWLQPGGHIEPGETNLVDSAQREVLEETGHNVELHQTEPIDIDVHTIPANPKKGEPAHQHFDVRFVFVATDLSSSTHEDIEHRWLTLDEVRELTNEDSVLRVVEKILA